MPMTGRPGPASDTSKLLAALGYLWPVALVAILIEPYKDEPFVKFHAIQSLGLALATFIVGAVIAFIPIVDLFTGFVGLIYLIVAVIYGVKAYNGEYAEMPLIYGVVKSYMK
jgi:uncharacterized membrane protein